ncbi:MAG: hypothetical protein ACHQ15_04635 [Candidatus Limnocylindrales bacterium]
MSRPTDQAPPTTLVGWLAQGALDPPLAALLWQLMEGGLPLTVAGPAGSGRHALLAALAELRPAPIARQRSRLPEVVEADSLAALDALLAAAPYGAQEDELRTLGVVLVLGAQRPDQPGVVVAHYVRPLELDGHGHVQRRPPAVLASWDPAAARFDDYAWGILSELAARVGVEARGFSAERQRRSAYLAGLVAAGDTSPDDVRRALAGYRVTANRL